MEYKVTSKYTNEIIEEVLRIQKTKGLTPERIVEEAENKNNPLHSLFEWNDNEAAQSWRLQQARVLVNEIKVVIDDKEYYAFENVSVIIKSNTGEDGETQEERAREYKPVVEILGNDELRRQVIASALQHLRYWETQNGKYIELSPIIKASEKVRKKLEKKWHKKKK